MDISKDLYEDILACIQSIIPAEPHLHADAYHPSLVQAHQVTEGVGIAVLGALDEQCDLGAFLPRRIGRSL